MATDTLILSNSLNIEQYKNAILYLVKYCNNDLLGKTKLYKLLYYLDFISYRDTGKSVTGDVYIKQEYGPVPSRVDEVLVELKKRRQDKYRYGVWRGGKIRVRFELGPEADLDESVFDQSQKELLENICNEFSGWSREKIVNQTHLEAPWFFSKPFEVVDYDYSKDIDFFLKRQ